jgi:hypothetical protein
MKDSQDEFKLDGKKFSSRSSLNEYIEQTYHADLDRLNWTAGRYYFYRKYGKTEGKCVISGKPTKFNDSLNRYERFHSEVEAKLYREQFKQRMQKTYGTTHLLNNPDQQKKMLDNRAISLDYKWNDGTVLKVTSKYEYDFLDYCENVLKLPSSTFTEPPIIYYKDNGEQKFYMPDFFIPSINLIVEIKGLNNHYQKRDQYKENLKKEAVIKEGFLFIQINDKNYTEFNILVSKLMKSDA